MADRAELIIALTGEKDALRSLQNLERAMNTLRGSKVMLQIEKSQIDRDIRSVNGAIRELTMGKNEVNVRINGIDHVITSVEQAQELLNQLTSYKRSLNLDTTELNAGLAAGREAMRGFKDDEDAAIAKTHELSDAIYALGTAVQSLGSMSGAIGNFAYGIADSFTRMTDFFGSDVFTTIREELTRMATKTLVGDFGKITSRYDIMSTFTDYMELAGVASDKAADALQRVNDSILGLPIGLDESAQRLRRYQMFLGDINEATNLTIGLQKAIYAGGANEQARTQTLYEIERLLTVGSLNTARQWNALIQGLGVSVRFLADELDVVDASDLPAMLSSGAVSTEEFLGALQRLGEGSSEAAQKLDSALDIYKGTLESWIANIQYAAVRGGQTILKALNETLKSIDGRGVVDYLSNIRDAMDDMYAGIGQWITRNPDAFSGIMDSLSRLMIQLEKINVSSIAEGVFANIARGIDMLTQALSRLPEGMLEEFVTFSTTLAGPLGALFKVVSSGLPILIGVFNRFKDFDFEMLLDKIIRQVELLAAVVEKVLNLLPDGMMADLMAFGLVWGKPLAAALTALGAAVTSVANGFALAGNWTAAGNGISMIVAFAQAHPAIALAAAALTALAAAVAVFVGEGQAEIQSLSDRLGIDEFVNDLKDAKDAVEGINDVLNARDNAFANIEAQFRSAKSVLEEIRELDANAFDSVSLDRLESLAAVWNNMFPDAELSIDKTTRALDANSRAVLESADAYVEAASAIDEAAAAAKYCQEILNKKFEIKIKREALDNWIADLEDKISQTQYYLDNLRELGPEGFKVWQQEQENLAVYQRELEDARKEVSELAQEEERLGYELDATNRHLSKATKRADEATTALEKVKEKLNEIKEGIIEGIETHGISDSLQKLMDKYNETAEAIEDMKNRSVSAFDELSEAEAVSIADMQKIMEENIRIIREYADNYHKALALLYEYRNNPAAVAYINEVLEAGLGRAAEVDALINASREELDKLWELYDEYMRLDERRSELQSVEPFVGAMHSRELYMLWKHDPESYPGGREAWLSYLESQYPTEGEIEQSMTTFRQRIKSAMTGRNSPFTNIEMPDGGEGKGAGWVDKLFDGVSDAEINGAVSTFNERIQAEITNTLKPFENLELPDGGENVTKVIDPLIKAIAGEENSLASAVNEVSGELVAVTTEVIPEMNGAMEGEVRTIETLTNDGLVPLQSELSKTQDETKKLTEKTELLGTEEDTTKGKTIELIEAISRLANMMASKIGVLVEFAGQIKNVGDVASEAARVVGDLASAISLLESKEITLAVRYSGVGGAILGGGLPTATSASTGGFIAENGVLYRKDGGSVFKPVGTDTVPAMLTPGEFVVNRNAVKKLGLPFMNALNHIDIGKAFDELIRTAYRPPQFYPVYSTVNNQTDNRRFNYSPNFYGGTAENASRRIASRWARNLVR